MDNTLKFSIDKENKKITVEKEFAAPVKKIRAAWTESKITDQWWAPKPWKTRTKIMNFTVGGYWLYAMVGPDGTEHRGRADFISIEPYNKYSLQDSFCDKDGNISKEFPSAIRSNMFSETKTGTKVSIEITYEHLTDLEKIIEMGFREGFTAALGNLDTIINV